MASLVLNGRDDPRSSVCSAARKADERELIATVHQSPVRRFLDALSALEGYK
jgi:hypothetical protein